MYIKTTLCILLVAAGFYYLLKPTQPLSDSELHSKLEGKVVLICGASSGIGEQMAYQLAPFGTKLVLVARNQDKLDKVRDGVINRGNENVRTISYDFSDVVNAGSVITQTVEWFGKLDYLVSNHAAMVSGPFLAFPHQQSPEYLERIFRINLLSQIELAIHALPHLESTSGHMFFTSSMAGEVPMYANSVYASTKHAMNGFFYSLQQELLAKESPVSLTVGAFGLILTKDLEIVVEKLRPGYLDEMPKFLVGDVNECARGMVESYVTRPGTMTYPRIGGYFVRLLWQYYPSYHDMVINMSRVPEAEGTGYEEVVQAQDSTKELKKELKFQQGYDGN